MDSKSPSGAFGDAAQKTSRAKRILYFVSVLLAVSSIVRMYVHPQSIGRVALFIFVCLLPLHQIYRFLTNGIMISRLGRSLTHDDVDNRPERMFYAVIHAVIVLTCIFFLISGKTIFGDNVF